VHTRALIGAAHCSFIAALPPVDECPSCHETFAASARNVFLNIDYKQTGATASPQGVSFAWLDASLQRDFVTAFDKLESPGVVAFSPRKKAYATFGACRRAGRVWGHGRAALGKGGRGLYAGKERGRVRAFHPPMPAVSS
jgi:hypothetical protein